MRRTRLFPRSFLLRKRVLKIGVTAGDPAGIGPEVSLKAINSIHDDEIIPVLFCRKRILDELYPDLFSEYETIASDRTEGMAASLKAGKKYVFDIPIDLPVPVPGRGGPSTGSEARAYIDRAVDLWKAGAIDALVTGPVSKSFIEKSGVHFTGHTEYIAQRIGERDPLMMMFSSRYRVLLATTHLPLSRVTESISEERLLNVMRIGYRSIRSIDGNNVRMAITGLDPHCGDDGAVGNFDREVTIPAVQRAAGEGIPIFGPFSADTLFMPGTWEKFNLVIAQYHDQGLPPFKMLAFNEGVNVTLGLSMIRTSVDHGTAFDIAGRNESRFSSMVEAIKLAKRLFLNKDN
jgi:4-hydroxythreonine-4-phosphate dehydrogenase